MAYTTQAIPTTEPLNLTDSGTIQMPFYVCVYVYNATIMECGALHQAESVECVSNYIRVAANTTYTITMTLTQLTQWWHRHHK